MSLARVKQSKARKQYRCNACDDPIEPGDQYLWYYIGFRSRYKHTRHASHGHPPRSQLESSNRAGAYAAVENGVEAIRALEVPAAIDPDLDPDDDMYDLEAEAAVDSFREDLETAVAEAGEGIREVADEYREADEAFGCGGMTQSTEIADELEMAADELDQFRVEAEDPEDMLSEAVEYLEGVEI